jgi:tetratricopeptide (TPR) repeat protein
MFRSAQRFYSPVYQGDTVILVPAESLARRYPTNVLDSLRSNARRRMNGVMDRWLAVAPDEGEAHFLQGLVRQAEKNYDGAEQSITEAMRLGVSASIPLEAMKLSWRLEARRLHGAAAYIDTLTESGRLDTIVNAAPLVAGSFVNAELLGGRLEMAKAHTDLLMTVVGRVRMTPLEERSRDLNVAIAPLVYLAYTDRLTAAELARVAADMERRVAGYPDSMRTSVRRRVGRVIGFAAATLGDTAMARRWAVPGGASYNGAAAWAAAAAGDRATAERLLAAGDTVRSQANEFALARAAELLGKPEKALRHYSRLDSLEYADIGTTDSDWLLLARSYPGRAAMYQAMGDTTRARDYYQRFIDLWRNADEALRPEVEKAQRAIGAVPRRETN